MVKKWAKYIDISSWLLILFMVIIITIASQKEVKPRDYQVRVKGDTVYVYDQNKYVKGFIDSNFKNLK